jgi:hypothetical protein
MLVAVSIGDSTLVSQFPQVDDDAMPPALGAADRFDQRPVGEILFNLG